MPLVAIEANIAAGKSTMVPQLCKHLGWNEVLEPADSDPEFNRLLNEFTSNPTDANKRIEFQMYVTNNRSSLLEGIDTVDDSYVIERSLFSDLIFSQTNFLGTERPNAAYMSYYYDIKKRLEYYPKVDAIVYLRTDPEVVYNRMLGRGRAAEQGTPVDYVRDLHRFHDACLPQICREYDTKLITVDWTYFGENYSNDPIGMVADLIRKAT